ncbi:hypothetical protein Dda_9369 [Drechslerella dactyloides]|uniref:Rhodopsin domain-containing protein n=1 Tax=Drechslerella dactyloides TaxID=74499 RepID=A0AAD6NF50_DREDA|nr:hypothetical protein Dda_9369 [Drechslerella dactyloides]
MKPFAFLSVISLIFASQTLARAHGVQGVNEVDCQGRQWDFNQVQAASEDSLWHIQAGTFIGNNGYPHHFLNREGFDFHNECHEPLYEFPIVRGREYDGGAPNTDRVIIGSVRGNFAYFCGVEMGSDRAAIEANRQLHGFTAGPCGEDGMASPTTTFSTGQTLQDLAELARLRALGGASKPPGWAPPAVLDPNYVPPVNLDGVAVYTGTVFLVASTLMVAWKIIATQRTRSSKLLFLEDWLLLLALAGQVAYVAITWLANNHQMGWHIYDLKYDSLINLYKYTGAWNLVLLWIYCTSRASLLVSIRRLYSPIKTRIKLLIDILAIGKLFSLICCTFAFVFDVPQHPEALFDLESAVRNGADLLELDIRMLAAQAAFDTVILLLPLPLFWMLRGMPERRRTQTAIVCICVFWVTTMFAGYTRLVVIIHMKHIIYHDFSWYLPRVVIANHVEIFLTMITTCLPTANLLFKWVYNKPRIPSASAAFRRTIRKSRLKRRADSTVESMKTVATDDTYDAEWSKGDTTRSEFSPDDSIDIIKPPSIARVKTIDEVALSSNTHLTIKPAPGSAAASIRRASSIIDGFNEHRYSHSSNYHLQTRTLRFQDLASPSRKSTVSLRDTDVGDEEEDNFYEMLAPSDSFFPLGTGLRPRPRPTVRENHELELRTV